jgi:hypothetical protein
VHEIYPAKPGQCIRVFSFVKRVYQLWNPLPDYLVCAETLLLFKEGIVGKPFYSAQYIETFS